MAQSKQVHAILRFIKERLPYIRNSDASYVNEYDPTLKNLEIEIEPLCFDDGDNSGNDGEVSSEPLTFSRMSDLVKEKEPWAAPHNVMTISSIRKDKELGNSWIARYLGIMLVDYLDLNKDDAAPGILQDLEKESLNFPNGCAAWLTSQSPRWRVEKWIDSPTSPEPRLSCFVSEESDLEEQQLSMSVLQILLVFTFYRLCQEKFKQYQSVPITIVSASGLHVRIHRASFKLLEGYKGQISVKKSPIINLTNVEGPISDDIIHILRWMVGSSL
ncbi:hypothetical protein F5B19DRAFT_201322 [Rostrohypoxylon terebratum]|nr:hypothetical protein F5B19DRAFT_201322 [Rostrohypoxylon terebratum]